MNTLTNSIRSHSKSIAFAILCLFSASSAPAQTPADDYPWADVTGSVSNWHTSSWYGVFYGDSANGDWIWHDFHGWQYVYSASTISDVFLWDDASVSWWYIAPTYYPFVYSYGTEQWYCYTGGTTPERGFWDYSRDALVAENRLATLGSGTNPYANEEVTEATLDMGGTYSLFDDFFMASWPPLTVVPDIRVGDATSDNHLTIQNGSTVECANLYIGEATTEYNFVYVTGHGTTVTCDGVLEAGIGETGNGISITDGALVKTDSLSLSGTLVVGIGSGFLALPGDQTSALQTMVDDQKFMIIFEGDGNHTMEIRTDVNLTYYSDIEEEEAFAATGYHALNGFTVVSSGEEMPNVFWAEATDENADWWYVSPWYGNFYTDVSYGNKIWHSQHGWQYIHEGSTPDDVNLWDDGTQSEWYTSKDDYPELYNYSTGRFYEYLRGTSPDRVFWDYTAEAEVSEADIALSVDQ
ncbi:MAG: hypothetical protein WC360_04305 [Opitutales bacterium]|jgi:hypothetical protein